MRKIIKKILYIIGWVLILIISLGILCSLLIKTPGIQDYITSKTFKKLDDKFGNHFYHSGAKYKLFNKIELTDLLITDQENDTIIFSPRFKANFPGLIRNLLFNKEAPVKIGGLTFDDAYFRIYTDSNNVDNIRFIFDTLAANKDTTKKLIPLTFNRISIKNSRLSLYRFDTSGYNGGINLSNMEFNNLNTKVKNFRVYADTLSMRVKSMDFVEKSGLKVKNCETDLEICSQHLYFSDLNLTLNRSEMELERVFFDCKQLKDFGNGGIFDKVRVNIKVNKSTINLIDLGYFSPVFKNMDYKVRLAGNFNGKFSDLNVRNLVLTSGNNTLFKGKFDMTGLPDVNTTFLFFDIDEFVTDMVDISQFKLPNGKTINLPDKLNNIKSLSYKGNFTGFFKDFVSFGVIETDHGSIMTDILFAPDSSNQVNFSGQLRSNNFNLGVFTANPEMLGNIQLNLHIDGKGRIDGGFDVDLQGDIAHFEVNKYDYSNITVDGNFSENRFNGNVEIDDPNAKLSFDGLVDLSSDIRKYQFSANVLEANLFNLNFHEKDSNYTGSFLINADLTGNSLDEINGNVKLLNSLFSKTDAQIQVYDLQLDIINDSTQNELKIRSDFMDGVINGHFLSTQLLNEYILLSSELLPAFTFNKANTPVTDFCNFEYQIDFKNSVPIFNFFLPEYRLNPKTQIEGSYTRDSTIEASIHLSSPEIRIGKTALTDAVLNLRTSDSTMQIDLGCKNAMLNERISLDNFTVLSSVDSNKISFNSRWTNWDTLLYKGSITGDVKFLNKHGDPLKSSISIDSTYIVINDSTWNFNSFEVLIDSSSLYVENFLMQHGNEMVNVSGTLSDMNSDSLSCHFTGFDFSNLNSFTRSSQFKFGGLLNGDVIIKGYSKPLVFAEMLINDLALNDELLGDTYLKTHWDNDKESLVVDADIMRGKLNTLNITGDIYPLKDSEMDLVLNFNKFRLEFVNPYLDNVFDNVRGLATGSISLSGTTKEPNLNGNLNLQKAAFTVDYLNTRYSFTSNLGISNNNLVFDNILMYDRFGNTANLNGLIRTDYFKTFNLGLTISAEKFLFLNTTQADNESFYGTAFATGIVRANGEPSSLKFDVTVRTEAGTDFNIPLSGNEELAEYTFIRYTSSDDLDDEKEEVTYDVNLTGMQLNFDLKVTPEAKVKLIFDPTMGDIIEATGSGDMLISINPLGDLKILGEYVIEQGDYLFTLKDALINKKFKVEQGSSLRWSGDPVNADIDISTYYRTKASLNDLDITLESSGSKTVDCQLELSGKLMSPNVEYDIYLPYSEQATREKVATSINTDEEKGKQFLSLLILNQFFYAGTSSSDEGNIDGGNIAGVNASELLSNQLSNWLSQISNDFDIGVSYRPGTEISSQEVELALSTQLLNDRLSINGSVDMKTNADVDQANSIVGDVDIDYKITKNGKIRARVFNRGNENEIITNSKYTQGVGIFYTEEFDKFSEVIKRYKERLSRKKTKDKENQESDKNNDIKEAIKEEDEEEAIN